MTPRTGFPAINRSTQVESVQQNKPKQAIDYYQRAVYEYWPASALPDELRARGFEDEVGVLERYAAMGAE